MSGFGGQRARPWMGGAAQPEAAAGDGARDADAAAAASSMKDLGTSTNASAISFGFAATAILISMFLIMAIFEHLIKPSWGSSSRSSGGDDGGQSPSSSGTRPRGDGAPDKLRHSPKVEEAVVAAAEVTVLMPGQRYPTFLAQPTPLLPCPREGMEWPPHHVHGHSFLSP